MKQVKVSKLERENNLNINVLKQNVVLHNLKKLER